LMMGLVSGYPINVEMTGDESLRSRPMNRILKPLRLMRGLDTAGPDGQLPFAIVGTESLKAITYVPPIASAQVKSAVMLAGLNAEGTTIVEEARQTRDHTERMLRGFGV
ncbi:MAG TPA: 3-phosphoshikimate 1-carboxyvinyltransferase, partial [Hyphomonas sp.]|nr:3-phosphoshikimate 1-carboxyvinyltransferase [Hyphomonas sp.]